MDNSVPTKSCDPQLLQEMPSRSWKKDQLIQYVQAQQQAIVEGERTLAPLLLAYGYGPQFDPRELCSGRVG